MLIPKGQTVHENLSTSFTHIEQLVEGLRRKYFSGYCHVSFWEYDGMLFLHEGHIVNAQEEIGMRGTEVLTGDTAIAHILAKAREKDGNISVYQLSAKTVKTLLSAMHVTPKYEALSTDLTSLDRVMALLQKEQLSGYIEILFEHDAGLANLLLAEGEVIESLFAPPDNLMIGERISIAELDKRCQNIGAVFNVYQTIGGSDQIQGISQVKIVSPQTIKLFEAILTHLESVTNAVQKEGTFQTAFKMILPQVADTYTFLDPFIGDFRYSNGILSFEGNTPQEEFVNGMCELLNRVVKSLFQNIPRHLLLTQLSRSLEPVSTTHAGLIEELQLETRLPELFRDYSFLQYVEAETEEQQQGTEIRKVLNLQGVGVSEIGDESILKEFYRVIARIAGNYKNAGGKDVQYSQLKKSREYQQYQTAIAFLQQLSLSSLHSRDEQLAFWINLYNFLSIDAVLKLGVKTSVQNLKGFFMKASYRLGEFVFSLDDIEHGILRNNQRKPYSLFHQFSSTDPRVRFCVNPVDPRIHCCFTCAATSSAPLAVYMPEGLDEQLDQAVTRFLLNGGMRFEPAKQELWLSRIFYWYRKDVENSGIPLLDFVLQALQGHALGQELQQIQSKLTLRFLEYDWSLNGK